ncbi:MAG: (2Fe-2S)-binding protein [Deltaproteobacteria bacterium]|nr:(2Fe-2S)-binding protein [Deltaproteobacteria bacterium]
MTTVTVNGIPREVSSGPLSRLLDVLREELGLTGTKEGCGEGECGSCTVLLDGVPVNACLVAVGQCDGRRVTTVEGLQEGPDLTPLARCLIDGGGAQCGICTPGMLVSASHLLARNPSPDEAQVREALAGNLCRCTGYQRIVDSVLEASRLLRARREGASP